MVIIPRLSELSTVACCTVNSYRKTDDKRQNLKFLLNCLLKLVGKIHHNTHLKPTLLLMWSTLMTSCLYGNSYNITGPSLKDWKCTAFPSPFWNYVGKISTWGTKLLSILEGCKNPPAPPHPFTHIHHTHIQAHFIWKTLYQSGTDLKTPLHHFPILFCWMFNIREMKLI